MVDSTEIIAYLKEKQYYLRDNKIMVSVSCISSLLNQKKNSLSWSLKDSIDISTLECNILIVGKGFSQFSESMCIIHTIDPRTAFASILQKFFLKENIVNHISAKASIAQKVIIGKKCYIGDNVSIGETCFIGDNVVIHPNVVIHGGTIIGNGVIIASGAVIGGFGFGFAKHEDGTYERMPHIGGVVLGDKVEIGANTCIDAGVIDPTYIGSGTKISNICQVAHNVKIGKNCVIAGNVVIAGSSTIEDDCWIGPSCTIVSITIGLNSFVKAGSLLTKNVPPRSCAYGNPAKSIPERLLGSAIKDVIPR